MAKKINSRNKGADGEREIANILRDEYGFDTRRGQQFCGSNGDADVVGLPGIHLEVKRVEALNMDLAYEQACNDAKEDEMPTVVHRKNHKHWKVTLSLEDFMKLYQAYTDSQEVPLGERTDKCVSRRVIREPIKND